MNALLVFVITLVSCLGLWLGNGAGAIAQPPVFANLHTYPDPKVPQQVIHRSLQTLRDESGQAWQTVFYKQVKNNQVNTLHLRLVGFPGISHLVHPAPLRLRDGQGNQWEASDVFDQTPLKTELAVHVGEYDLRPIALEALDTKRPLWLEVLQQDEDTAIIPVPPFAVQEWQQLLDQ